jgi:hypothetical protein
MMARRAFGLGFMGLLAGASSLLLFGCAKRKQLRYRITVEIDTPNGLKSGFSVMETRQQGPQPLVPSGIGGGGGGGVIGEAVAVDLGDGRVIFALLSGTQGRSIYDIVPRALNYPELKPPLSRRFEPHEWQEAYDEAADVQPLAILKREDYPMLVTFDDLADPKSVKAVNPDIIGVRRITLHVTDDPVTTGIEKRLEWLNHLDKYLVNQSNPFTSNLPQEISGLRSHLNDQ